MKIELFKHKIKQEDLREGFIATATIFLFFIFGMWFGQISILSKINYSGDTMSYECVGWNTLMSSKIALNILFTGLFGIMVFFFFVCLVVIGEMLDRRKKKDGRDRNTKK